MARKADERWTDYVPLSKIQHAPRNPKGHDPAIGGSISRFGFAELPLLDERTGRLVAGHGRLDDLAARKERGEAPPKYVVASDGEWLVPVQRGWSSTSDPEAEGYLVASNRTGELGGWDTPGLAAMLADIAAVDVALLEAAGYTEGELDDLRKLLEAPDLDALAGSVGAPEPEDMWPTVRLRVPSHVAAAWNAKLAAHGGDELVAFASLLGVGVQP